MTTIPTEKSSKRSGKRRKSRGLRVIRWIETHCVATDGEWIGQPAKLLLWQKFFIMALFTIGEDGLRVYRWCLLGIPKKNGKTQLAAWLALYFLIGDNEPSPLVVCAAASDEQADLVFEACKRCIELSPTLVDICEPYDKEILVPSIPGARLVRVAAAVGTNDGKNIHAVICDELHEWAGPKGRKVWTVLTNGTGSRRQPMVLQITTAGYDEDTVCYEQYDHGKRVETGEVEDESFLFHWIEAPEGADYRDVETWKAANPSWGQTLPDPERYLSDQLKHKKESEFRRYFLNQWVAAEEFWLADGEWDACKDPSLELDPALPTHVGIDGFAKKDSAAVVVAQDQRSINGRVVVRAFIWENPYSPQDSRYGEWKFQLAKLENRCITIRQEFTEPTAEVDGEWKPGPAFNYDPMLLEKSAQDLEGQGLTMIEFPQNDQRMCPAAEALYGAIVTKVLAHDGHPGLRRHVYNAIAIEKPRGWRLGRPKGSRKKTDAAIALSMAVASALAPQSEEGEILW